MPLRSVSHALTIAVIASILAGCGNKGPLVKPTPTAPATQAAPAEATPPATR
ncbi:MAG: lipoprotein [Dokdonella sp.]|uniref:LPS translocon maturation chaperone LptM n=1 Tax=Dokdonella sp. TaxID=2291710 RepID=UPI0032630391